MPRTIIDIPISQMRDLDARCRALRISRAEGIRRAVQAFLNVRYALEEEGFGLWSRGGTEGRARTAREDKAP